MTPVTPVVACDPSDPAEPSVTPVVSVTGSLAAAAGEVESVAAHALWRLGEVEVNASLAWVGRLRTVLDRAEVALVGEAVGRGLAKDEGMSAVDRVVAAEGAVAPVPDPRRVAQVVKVADACRGASGPTDATAGADAGVTGVTGVAGAAVMPGAEVFAAAFTSGVMGVEKGGMIARFAADLQKVRSAATRRADALLALVGAGVAPTSTPTPTPSSTPTLTPSLTPTSARGAALGAAVDGSPDDEAGEAGAGGETGPGAPGDGSTFPGRPDGRDGQDGPAVGDRAQVVVMIGYDQLFGSVPGAGITITGEVLSPAVVRRMARDARIIPMVLAGTGQTLDLGNRPPLLQPRPTPGLLAPRPPLHLPRLHHPCHHTLVHDHDLTATIDDTRVTWHL